MFKRIVDVFCMESDSENVVGFSIRGGIFLGAAIQARDITRFTGPTAICQ